MVMWWHGPEHETKDRLFRLGLLNRLEKIAIDYIIIGFPYGKAPQGVVKGNIREIHVSTLYPGDFKNIGYETEVIGLPDVPGSHVLAYKRLS
jgi:hypothetical protein